MVRKAINRQLRPGGAGDTEAAMGCGYGDKGKRYPEEIIIAWAARWRGRS
ncbi:MAG: hypothetical protein VYE18_01520 [Pseudomonadota bacterium]|nr:hypothetical protein [Pseudomonadota bacterium]